MGDIKSSSIRPRLTTKTTENKIKETVEQRGTQSQSIGNQLNLTMANPDIAPPFVNKEQLISSSWNKELLSLRNIFFDPYIPAISNILLLVCKVRNIPIDYIDHNLAIDFHIRGCYKCYTCTKIIVMWCFLREDC